MNSVLALPWSGLSERERAVWAAVFARQQDDPHAAVRAADAAVHAMRALSLDGEVGMDPEYDAARAGYSMELDEFAPWYRVAWRIRHGHRQSFRELTPEDVDAAFERFQRGRSDVY